VASGPGRRDVHPAGRVEDIAALVRHRHSSAVVASVLHAEVVGVEMVEQVDQVRPAVEHRGGEPGLRLDVVSHQRAAA